MFQANLTMDDGLISAWSGNLTPKWHFVNQWMKHGIISTHLHLQSATMTSPLMMDFTTRFAYPIRTEEAQKAVEEGIAMLKECAPFVVVFNPEFSGININIDTTDCSEELCFKVLERSPLEASGIEQITVAESNSEVRKYLLAKGDKVSVTVLNNDNSECLPVEETPTAFLGFSFGGYKIF